MYINDFKGKKQLVSDLSDIYRNVSSDIGNIELKKYYNDIYAEEFIVLTWANGGISTANNNMNSLSATARNVARMLDGGVYQNFEYYNEIMNSDVWKECE